MSQLNDLDNELVTIPHDAKAIAKAWGDKIRQLANNSKVEKETLELLVCCAYHLEEITEGRAAEILGLFRLDFGELYNQWSDKYQKDTY